MFKFKNKCSWCRFHNICRIEKDALAAFKGYGCGCVLMRCNNFEHGHCEGEKFNIYEPYKVNFAKCSENCTHNKWCLVSDNNNLLNSKIRGLNELYGEVCEFSGYCESFTRKFEPPMPYPFM